LRWGNNAEFAHRTAVRIADKEVQNIWRLFVFKHRATNDQDCFHFFVNGDEVGGALKYKHSTPGVVPAHSIVGDDPFSIA